MADAQVSNYMIQGERAMELHAAALDRARKSGATVIEHTPGDASVFYDREVRDEGVRSIHVFYVGPFKVHFDPEEGSVSCECATHAEYVLDMTGKHRCTHSASVWRQLHAGGLLG
jgi:hypothetical protein